MRQLRRNFRATVGQLLAAGLAITGCATAPSAGGPQAESGSASAATEQEEAAQGLREHHRHYHHGGVAMFIAMSLDSLGLPSEKEAQADKIETDLAAALAPARTAEQDVLAAVHDGVAAGAIDSARVDVALAQLAAAAAGVHDAVHNSVNELHALLSPVERRALVDKVRAHAAVWIEVNEKEKPGSHGKGTHLDRLTAELDLTPDQVSRIEQGLSALPAPDSDAEAVRTSVDAFSRAFVADTFDAATLTKANAGNTHIARSGAARMAHFYEVVTPVLTPEQREKLATRLGRYLTAQATTQANAGHAN